MCCSYRGKRGKKIGWRRTLLMVVAALAIGAVLLAGTLYQRSLPDRPRDLGAAVEVAALAACKVLVPQLARDGGASTVEAAGF